MHESATRQASRERCGGKGVSGGLAARRQGTVPVHELADAHAHATPTCSPPPLGKWPVYQGRFKSLPLQEDAHFHTLYQYVERKLRPDASQRLWRKLHERSLSPAEAAQRLDKLQVNRVVQVRVIERILVVKQEVGAAPHGFTVFLSAGTGKHASPPRPPPKAQQRVLIPFLLRATAIQLDTI